jgi:hypothetical protein
VVTINISDRQSSFKVDQANVTGLASRHRLAYRPSHAIEIKHMGRGLLAPLPECGRFWRGAQEAGAVFVMVALLDGSAMLYVPAPQTVYDDSRPIERLFMPTSKAPVPEPSVEERLQKEIRFDPDAWIVETEDRTGRHFLDLSRD